MFLETPVLTYPQAIQVLQAAWGLSATLSVAQYTWHLSQAAALSSVELTLTVGIIRGAGSKAFPIGGSPLSVATPAPGSPSRDSVGNGQEHWLWGSSQLLQV